ncbi:lmo0937 family membrane protein [Empedobacter sp. UBA7248]|uniref:lmo0937 family membrane protein n=1 Tax=Empedobacter sp. UBA7248 TaxID=1946448 RepID=UPI0039C8A16C
MKNSFVLIAIILIILWLLGYFGLGLTYGGFIHFLLLMALITLVLRFLMGKGEN